MPTGKSCVAEVYPSLFSRRYDNAVDTRGPHSHDAYAVCRWMMETDACGVPSYCLQPSLSPSEKATAATEGWILGVM